MTNIVRPRPGTIKTLLVFITVFLFVFSSLTIHFYIFTCVSAPLKVAISTDFLKFVLQHLSKFTYKLDMTVKKV